MRVVEASNPAFYESYLNSLTEGTIRNQAEQTNEENKQASTQTELGTPAEVGTQFPDIGLKDEDIGTYGGSTHVQVASSVATSDKVQEKLKDPHYKDRLLRFLEDKVNLLEDVFEAQSLRNSKNAQFESLDIPSEIKEVAPNFSINREKVYFSDRLNALIIIRVSSSSQVTKL